MPRYNQYNRNRLSLNTVDFQPTVFTPIEFRPVEQDYSILERAMAKQEERKQKALAQQANIKAAISQVELDESEDEWKQNYINNIDNQIKNAAAVGDYAGALETATMIAGNVANDPALVGRERYNKERKNFLNQLEEKRSKGLISDDSYERAIAQNKYNYHDITDDSGKIVGGAKWTPEFQPLNDIDLGTVLAEMQQFMGISSETIGGGGGTTQQYRRADGTITTNPNDPNIQAVVSTTKNGGRTESTKEVTADDWRKAYDAYIARHPEDEARLNQLWENARYNFATLTNKAANVDISEEDRQEAQRRANNFWSNLTDKQGGLLSKDDWLLKQISPSFEVMAYKQHSLVTEGSSTMLDTDVLKNKTIASVFNLSYTQAELYAQGAPMEVILEENVDKRRDLIIKGQKQAEKLDEQVVE